MKKILTLVAFIATISMTAQAQFDFGVKGGLNLSKLSLDKKVVSSDNQVGWFIGPTVKFSVPLIGIESMQQLCLISAQENLNIGLITLRQVPS